MRNKKNQKNTQTTIPNEVIRQQSGMLPDLPRVVESLKRTNYYVIVRPIMGDAPKNFIKVYEYGKGNCKRVPSKSWIPYIAKVGHKWYPNESITEYLMVRVGEVLGLNMAKARLAIINGQLRFLSQFFLKKNEVLNHGAEIFSNYLCDPDFISHIGIRKEEQHWFTFQFVEAALKAIFNTQANEFLETFIKLLVFDAITGNNDRHHYNWGIITSIKDENYQPRFAPIYDTARGLFWSTSDAKIQKWFEHPKQLSVHLKKYADNAKPQTGWEGYTSINHFQLVELLVQDARFVTILQNMCSLEKLPPIFHMIDQEFTPLMHPLRRTLIKQYIQYRFERLQIIIHQQK
jgi:hypothetical protein